MGKDFSELTGMELDALREIGNIGAGNAATALAQMVQTKIDMSVPEVNILPFDEIPKLVGGADAPVCGLYFEVSGSIRGSILFMLPIERAGLLVDMILARPLGETDLNLGVELEFSVIMEVGNIISGTYLNALSHFTNMKLLTSVPALAIDMAGAILNGILAQVGAVFDDVLVLKTMFTREDRDIVGHFFMMPDSESLSTILQGLGVNC